MCAAKTLGLFAPWQTQNSAVDTKAGEAVMLWIYSVVQIRVSTEIANRCPIEIKQCKRSSREGLNILEDIVTLSPSSEYKD